MKIRSSIQFKAIFLTFVFLLNTVVGFACAVGVDVKFSDVQHHNEDKAVPAHEHVHLEGHHHDHKDGVIDHHHAENNCCKDEVAKLRDADKLSQRSYDFGQLSLPIFIIPDFAYHQGNSFLFPVNTPNAYFSRHWRPPIVDVRIAIQSFQI